ncbi:MAG: aldose epimerase family protein [Acidimicrobiales bacterium]
MPERHGTTAGHELQPPTAVHRHRLRAPSGLTIDVLDLGATLDRVEVPGPDGRRIPLTLSLPDVTAREDRHANPYLGVTVGRWANRLRGSRFEIDGVEHRVAPNEGEHQLHGGPVGFDRLVWDTAAATDDRISFSRVSPTGEMGFPGRLEVGLAYEVTDRTIRITHTAGTDQPTIVSMTNHSNWNLGGPQEDTITTHTLTNDADRVVPVDDHLLPRAAPVAVDDTDFDFRGPTRLADRVGPRRPDGYDHCFVVGGDGFRRHARLDHPTSGRSLEVWSDQPAVQLYTGGYLEGGPGADGRNHGPFAGLCLEPQQVPDAPNLAWAASPVLRPGERYVHRLEFRLDWP